MYPEARVISLVDLEPCVPRLFIGIAVPEVCRRVTMHCVPRFGFGDTS